jgi:carbon storage regulator
MLHGGIGGMFADIFQHDWRTTEGRKMLVLSRKLGEKIFIGESICITVVDIDRGKIRLGIEAPRDVPIYRQELLPLAQQTQPVQIQKLPAAS